MIRERVSGAEASEGNVATEAPILVRVRSSRPGGASTSPGPGESEPPVDAGVQAPEACALRPIAHPRLSHTISGGGVPGATESPEPTEAPLPTPSAWLSLPNKQVTVTVEYQGILALARKASSPSRLWGCSTQCNVMP